MLNAEPGTPQAVAGRVCNLRPALKHLLRLLRDRGRGQAEPDRIDVVLERFCLYLRNTGGLSEATCHCHARYLRKFLRAKFGRGALRWEALRPSDVGTGKGRKQRTVPLWRTTAQRLREWMERIGQEREAPLFPNRDCGRVRRDPLPFLIGANLRLANYRIGRSSRISRMGESLDRCSLEA